MEMSLLKRKSKIIPHFLRSVAFGGMKLWESVPAPFPIQTRQVRLISSDKTTSSWSAFRCVHTHTHTRQSFRDDSRIL